MLLLFGDRFGEFESKNEYNINIKNDDISLLCAKLRFVLSKDYAAQS